MHGFTLIEISVTLVILAIVAAITVPAFTGYIDKAHESMCETYRENLDDMYLEYCYWEGLPTSSTFTVFAEKREQASFKCPSGGSYSWDDVDQKVVCSFHKNI